MVWRSCKTCCPWPLIPRSSIGPETCCHLCSNTSTSTHKRPIVCTTSWPHWEMSAKRFQVIIHESFVHYVYCPYHLQPMCAALTIDRKRWGGRKCAARHVQRGSERVAQTKHHHTSLYRHWDWPPSSHPCTSQDCWKVLLRTTQQWLALYLTLNLAYIPLV